MPTESGRKLFGEPGWHEQNKRDILRGNIERESAIGRGVRPHEVEKTVEVAASLFHGDKGNGQAAKEAIDLVRKGLA